MCRLAAYNGETLGLETFLLSPPHSLIEQAHAPQEAVSATVNADGIGFGWYTVDGQPAIYRNVLPAWADPNLEGLGRSLASRTWLANVRSATDPLSNGYANTQPFSGDGLLFLHNGNIEGFNDAVRGPLRHHLSPDLEREIHGTTDSEYLFAWLRQALAQHNDDLIAALRAAMKDVERWLDDTGLGALLNIVVARGDTLVALRHAVRRPCPSLHSHAAHPRFRGGRLVASEPLDDDTGWQAVPPHHIVVMEPGHEATTFPL